VDLISHVIKRHQQSNTDSLWATDPSDLQREAAEPANVYNVWGICFEAFGWKQKFGVSCVLDKSAAMASHCNPIHRICTFRVRMNLDAESEIKIQWFVSFRCRITSNSLVQRKILVKVFVIARYVSSLSLQGEGSGDRVII
jgi:hypothetical protein